MSIFVIVAAGLSISNLSLPDGCLDAPVSAPIVERFEQPACPYCAGRRTTEFAVTVGAAVRAPVTGIVTFAGEVAGQAYLTIGRGPHAPFEHLVTLGGVAPAGDSGVAVGAAVEAGQPVGAAVSTRIRLSLRRIVAGGEAEYLDPESALARWRSPVRLVPDPNSDVLARRQVPRRWSCRSPLRPVGNAPGD